MRAFLMIDPRDGAGRYDLTADPLELTNLARARPEVYRRLLTLLLAHVRTVEAGNPAIARQGAARAAGLMGCARRRS